MHDTYERWGFLGSPFHPTALPPNAIGVKLLIGRDKERAQLRRRIANAPKITCVEGANGIGKTSLINVTAFEMLSDYLDKGRGSFILPCQRPFQLTPDRTIQDFRIEVLMEVAQTLISFASMHPEYYGLLAKNSDLSEWLNSPVFTSIQGSLSLLGAGIGKGSGESPNTSRGFIESGLERLVTSWLQSAFNDPKKGGIVCVIDNLEILQTSKQAQTLLEQMRDTILTLPGLRWVLSGACGIALSVASSPRLDGLIHEPLEVHEVDRTDAADILRSRIDAYGKEGAYLPLHMDDFTNLYTILNGNIRSALGKADDYCMSIDERKVPQLDREKRSRYSEWYSRLSRDYLTAAKGYLQPKALDVFQKVLTLGGEFSPSDYQGFGFKSMAALRRHIVSLEAAGLVQGTQDDSDRRRKTISVTPKGWIVGHAQQTERAIAEKNKQADRQRR